MERSGSKPEQKQVPSENVVIPKDAVIEKGEEQAVAKIGKLTITHTRLKIDPSRIKRTSGQ